jgi:hypothetical protein
VLKGGQEKWKSLGYNREIMNKYTRGALRNDSEE